MATIQRSGGETVRLVVTVRTGGAAPLSAGDVFRAVEQALEPLAEAAGLERVHLSTADGTRAVEFDTGR